MDEIRDQMDLANEISDAISQPVGFGLDLDEVGANCGAVFSSSFLLCDENNVMIPATCSLFVPG